MIIKGNARAGGANLAAHLMNTRDNDRVEVAEIRGMAANDVRGAFMEMEAVAAGTQCEKYLYSLSLNPTTSMTRAQYATAITVIEEKLGLTDQPRAIVFHHKASKTTGESREHCHIVWSRIDPETMKAKQLSFDRQKLRSAARELAHIFQHELPDGLKHDRGPERFQDRFNDQSWAEHNQAERTGMNKADRIAQITECYQKADSGSAFINALEEQGYYLARGDRRGFVVVDMAGEVHSLSRQIKGEKAAAIKAKLAPLTPDKLPDVSEARIFIAQRQQARVERDMAYSRANDTVVALEARQASLHCAQAAERMAQAAAHREVRKGINNRKQAALDDLKKVARDTFKPHWRELFQKQKAERDEFRAPSNTAFGRLRHLVKNVRNPNFFDGSGALSGAFKYLVKGEAPFAKLDAHHAKQRKELSRMLHLQVREHELAITKNFKGELDRLWKDEQRDRQLLLDRQKLDRNAVESALQVARDKSRSTGRGDAERTQQQKEVAKTPYQRAQELKNRGLGNVATERFSQTKSDVQSAPEPLAQPKRPKFSELLRNRPDRERSR